MSITKNIIITGFMGTGKTTIGKEVAQLLQTSFIDTDEIIERSLGRTIAALIRDRGESYFRELETVVIENLPVEAGLVISSGGGAVMIEKNFGLLKRLGIMFCLDTQIEILASRLRLDTTRPLLEGPALRDNIEVMLKERDAVYKRIPIHLDTSNVTPREAASSIIDHYRRIVEGNGADS